MLKVQSMGKAQKFEDLEIFQSTRNLCKEVYAITKEGGFIRDSRFVQQIHASSGSVMDNIAEGFEREGNKEFVNFLYIAKGSCGEVRSQIIRASDVGFIDNDTATRLYNDCIGLSKAISAFIKTLKDSGFAGSKFNRPSGSSKFNDLEP
jgi:four helix bundle protein